MSGAVMTAAERVVALRRYIIGTSERRTELPGTRWQGNPPQPTPIADTPDPTSAQPAPVTFTEFDVAGDGAVEPGVAMLRLPTPCHPDDRQDNVREAMSPAQRLATLIHYSIAPISFSPTAHLGQHRAHGSGGGRFAVAAEFVLPDGDSRRRCRWSAVHVALEILPETASSTALTSTQHRLVLVAQHGLLAHSYGAFAFWLTCLEGGMMAAQWTLVAGRLGYRNIHLRIAPPTPDVDSAWTDIALLSIDAEPPGDAQCLTEAQSETLSVRRARVEPWAAEHIPYLPHLLQAWRECEPPAPLAASAAIDPNFPLFAATIRRSSGVSGDFSRLIHGLAKERAEPWLAAANALYAATPFAGSPLVMSILLKSGPTAPPTAYAWSSAGNTLSDAPLAEAAATIAAGWFADMSAMIVTVGSDIQPAINGGDVPEFARALMAAGAWMHCLSLVAASHGAAARALKAVPDEQTGLVLPLETRPLLQLYVGFEDRPNAIFPL